MTEMKSFDVPMELKNNICLICGKNNVDVLVVENVPGGAFGTFHKKCIDEMK